MKTFLRTSRLLEESIVPPAPDRNDEEEKERYVTRQLWWALIGLILFALAMFLGWGGAHAETGGDVAREPVRFSGVHPGDGLPGVTS